MREGRRWPWCHRHRQMRRVYRRRGDSQKTAEYPGNFLLPNNGHSGYGRQRIYYDRPQICYNLATILLHEIYMGEYIKTKYLPSYEKMAQKYDVSVSTMRRTIRMLNEIGAVHTVNGKGTLVFTVGKQCKNPDFSSVLVLCFIILVRKSPVVLLRLSA